MTDELRGLLRESAEDHLPDRARMWARVERGTARPGTARRPRDRERIRALSWPKIVLATLATAGTLTAGVLTVVTVVHDPDPPRNPTAAAPSAVAPSTTGRAEPPREGSRTEDGPLWADGSVDPHSNVYWAQSNVTLKTGKPLTALVVELRIALTEGVKDTGNWRTRPPRTSTSPPAGKVASSSTGGPSDPAGPSRPASTSSPASTTTPSADATRRATRTGSTPLPVPRRAEPPCGAASRRARPRRAVPGTGGAELPCRAPAGASGDDDCGRRIHGALGDGGGGGLGAQNAVDKDPEPFLASWVYVVV